jgi:hypothetical protein
MADIKPQRRRLPTQLTQRPVPAPRSSSTTPLRHRSFIPQLTLPRATTLKPWSIILPWVTTPSRRWTWLRMLPHPTTPRLPSITLFSATYCTYFPKYYSVPGATPRLPLITPPKRQSTSLPWSTQPQLRRPSITQFRLTAQKLPFRATLNRKNTTLMLQSTTPRPTLHLATTRQPPSTTPKKPPITQLRTLPSLLHRGI